METVNVFKVRIKLFPSEIALEKAGEDLMCIKKYDFGDEDNEGKKTKS